MKKLRFIKGFAWWVALVAALAFSLWYLRPLIVEEQTPDSRKQIVTIWNVDTFEGGKGSRSAFLNSVAKELEGEHYFLVSSKTLEGVKYALEQGERPDLLSYGVGVEIETEHKPQCWCMGKYALYSRSGAQPPTVENTVVSRGGENEPLVAAALHGCSGEMKEEKSLQAYMDFLNGKYAYLLGTQRDAWRFQSRNVSVEATPINEYSDLRQYVVMMSDENKELCERYINLLCSEKIQARLPEIGMFSPTYSVYGGKEFLCSALESGKIKYFYPAYATLQGRETLRRAAAGVMRGEEKLENLKKLLKVT